MNHLKIIFLGIFTLFISSSSFGQNKPDIKIYTTQDRSVILYLLPNSKFGYTSFNGVSPNTFKDRTNKGIKPTPARYEVNEYGSGDYSLNNNKLKLNFTLSDQPIDSISKIISNTSYSKDSLEIKMIIKPYFSAKYLDSDLGIGTKVTSTDNSILLMTDFENYGEFKIAKSQLPLNLMINKNYELTIDTNSDQIIEIFVNPFKTRGTDKPKDKVLDFNSLTDITLE
ncbi:hypothetical protein [Salinimicrobium sp. TH3]|uniref:hypothetical protein n=1 Tax=Salinimicrobium sp. TH3 TaxID=2997342 RepID=UPI002275970E|nr:hypothetical protein [Salinimicrobium sp. TH3]MCY2686801.1 hypothetical protein [Salinimicrobium sp. TH3]